MFDLQAQEELTNASSQRKKDAARSEASVPHTLTEADIEAKQRNEALLLHARRMVLIIILFMLVVYWGQGGG